MQKCTACLCLWHYYATVLKNISQLDGATTLIGLGLISLQAKIMFSFLGGCRVWLLNVKIFKDNMKNMDNIYQHIIITFCKNPAIFHSGNNAACMVCLDAVTNVHVMFCCTLWQVKHEWRIQLSSSIYQRQNGHNLHPLFEISMLVFY